MHSQTPQLTLFLNNNPRCATTIWHGGMNQEMSLTNMPKLRLTGTGFTPDGEQAVSVRLRGALVAQGQAILSQGQFDTTLALASPLENPTELEIQVGHALLTVPIRLRTLSGTVRFPDGRPVPNPIVINPFAPEPQSMVATGDADGRFAIQLCGREPALAVLDAGYSRTTLETWLWEVNPAQDLDLDLTMDRGEVYRLHAWHGENVINLHFVPMSLTCVMRAMAKEGATMETIALDPNAHPWLQGGEIHVQIGGADVPVLTFQEATDYLSTADDGTQVSRPAYLLSVPRPQGRPGPVKLSFTRRTSDDETGGGDETEYGEGWFLGF